MYRTLQFKDEIATETFKIQRISEPTAYENAFIITFSTVHFWSSHFQGTVE